MSEGGGHSYQTQLVVLKSHLKAYLKCKKCNRIRTNENTISISLKVHQYYFSLHVTFQVVNKSLKNILSFFNNSLCLEAIYSPTSCTHTHTHTSTQMIYLFSLPSLSHSVLILRIHKYQRGMLWNFPLRWLRSLPLHHDRAPANRREGSETESQPARSSPQQFIWGSQRVPITAAGEQGSSSDWLTWCRHCLQALH